MTFDQFDDLIDSSYDVVKICGVAFNASYILKRLDPIAYQCFKNDVEDGNYDEEGSHE